MLAAALEFRERKAAPARTEIGIRRWLLAFRQFANHWRGRQPRRRGMWRRSAGTTHLPRQSDCTCPPAAACQFGWPALFAGRWLLWELNSKSAATGFPSALAFRQFAADALPDVFDRL